LWKTGGKQSKKNQSQALAESKNRNALDTYGSGTQPDMEERGSTKIEKARKPAKLKNNTGYRGGVAGGAGGGKEQRGEGGKR